MNTSDVAEAVARAVAKQPAEVRLRARHEAWGFGYWYDSPSYVDDDDLADCLLDLGELRSFDGSVHWLGDYFLRLDTDDLAKWLVWRGLCTSPAQSASELADYIKGVPYPFWDVLVIGGLSVGEGFELPSNKRAVPAAEAPPSAWREIFMRHDVGRHAYGFESFVSYGRTRQRLRRHQQPQIC
jgi:hypothetical protein